MHTTVAPPTTKPEDMLKSQAWTERHFASAADLPVSFVLDGKAVRGIPEAWHPTSSWRLIDANITETVFTGTDAATGLSLQVTLTQYRDYPVVEWVAWFTNTGTTATPIIRDILALDGDFRGSSPVLYHCNGDFYSAEGYTPQETALPAGSVMSFAPNGGRSCDGAFPYYPRRVDGWGLSLAIGWPTQWAARFEGRADGVHVRAGQEKTHLRLEPGETIRTPRMAVLFWSGDTRRGVNLWRRWYLAHLLPRPNGQPLQPLMVCAGTDEGEEMTGATEENQIRFIEKFERLGFRPDVWWIDAGWYPCRNEKNEKKWWRTGTWEPDPERFSRGFKPISDYAARYGANLLIWFEPERVFQGTRLDLEHSEWLLRKKDSESSLLNLGNPQCRQWLTDHVCRLIADNGIKIYRQDHNFPPLEYWRTNEPEDRQGMNENLHVQGYLRFWDDLLARNPGLWIDSCASGGRRNDLETMRRSVPLHYTDYGYGDHPIKLDFHRTMYEWLPYFKDCTLSWDIEKNPRFDSVVDSYSFHCGMAAMLVPAQDIRRDDYDYALALKMIAIWRRASGLLLFGDYYPHTPSQRSAAGWVVWQFDAPETGRGLVQAIRLPKSPEETMTVHLDGVHTEATYLFENPETGETKDIRGADLVRDGFSVALAPRSGACWFYQLRTA